jgi:RND superfamily putative drug exporter
MFKKLGSTVYGHAKLVLGVSLVVLVLAAVTGVHAFGKLKTGGFDDPSSQSSQAANLITQHFGGASNLVLLVKAKQGTVDTLAIAQAGTGLTAKVSKDSRISSVVSYWTTHNPALRSKDGGYGLVVGHLKDEDQGTVKKILAEYSQDGPVVSVQIGGSAAVGQDINGQVGKDLGLAEGIAIPLTLLLLVVVFGSMVSALLPLAIGIVSIFGTFAELSMLGSVTDVSIYAINLTTALGLALAIDYALFIVSRFREELDGGKTVQQAVVQSTATAGRTVIFSAVTVAVALSALAVFPLYFLRSFAYAGIGVVAISALSAVIILPALLTVLGKHIEAGKIPWVRGHRKIEAPFWRHVATFVMQHPAMTALPVIILLVVLASPLRNITFGTPDGRVLPTSAGSRQVGDILLSDFTSNQSAETDVVVIGTAGNSQLATYASRISALPRVSDVEGSAGVFRAGHQVSSMPTSPAKPDARLLTVRVLLDGQSDAAQALVKTIRDVPVPSGDQVYVGGSSATLVDTKQSIATHLPLAILIVVAAMLVVLFLFTGSIVQPLRALVLNSFTLAATIGVVVWIFQEGHLASLLGFTALPTNIPMTILLLCIAFGLSMDYEVFLMSRIKEMHDKGANTTDAVKHGLARAGRIVSAAAGILALSFFAFGTARISFLQLFGIGTGLAVLIDASLMRGVLVPVFMHIFGEHAWYAPKILKQLHKRIGISESSS